MTTIVLAYKHHCEKLKICYGVSDGTPPPTETSKAVDPREKSKSILAAFRMAAAPANSDKPA